MNTTTILNRLAPYNPQGAGANTQGGNQNQKGVQDKNVLHVRTLEDTDDGDSLRAAINKSGERIIVFNVCGVIRLRKPLDITKGNVTIDGSFDFFKDAPDGVGGICLRGFPVNVMADEVILRYLHLRLGDSTEIPNATGQLPTRLPKGDSLNLGKPNGDIKNVVLDHLSLSWSVDELLGIKNADNITLQYCILSEGLSNSFHVEDGAVIEHSKGALITLGNDNNKMTLYKNLFAHNRDRNPRVGLGKYDIRNNVFYNYGKRAAGVTSENNGAKFNYIGNFLKPGRNSPPGTNFFDVRDSRVRMFIDGNKIFNDPSGTTNNKTRVAVPTGSGNIFLNAPVDGFGQIPTDTPDVALADVLLNAGALLPRRDSVDERIVNDVRNGTGRIIDSPGYPDYCEGVPNVPDANTPDDDND